MRAVLHNSTTLWHYSQLYHSKWQWTQERLFVEHSYQISLGKLKSPPLQAQASDRGFKLARPRCTILISSTKDIANMRPDTEETELTTQVAQYLTAITMKMITPVLSSTTSQKGFWYCALIQKHFLRCCSGPFSSWCCGACCPDPSCSWAASTCASAQSSCLSVTMATWGSSAVERQSQV